MIDADAVAPSVAPPAVAPVRLSDTESALLTEYERRLDEATRAHALVCATLLAARGHRLDFDVRIVSRTGAELTLEPIPQPNA